LLAVFATKIASTSLWLEIP